MTAHPHDVEVRAFDCEAGREIRLFPLWSDVRFIDPWACEIELARDCYHLSFAGRRVRIGDVDLIATEEPTRHHDDRTTLRVILDV